MNKIWRDTKPDAQAFDEVRITTVPRYKQSDLSGDEWRISAKIELLRNGVVIAERSCRNVETACMFLPGFILEAQDNGKACFAGEDDFCDQEGCVEKATVTYRKKADYCHAGHKSAIDDGRITVRRFCDKHKTRGDCGLDDADANYERIEA